MSDSDFSLRSRSPTPVPEPKKKAAKVNKKSSHNSWYDSERCSPIPTEQKKKSNTNSEPPTKRKTTSSSAAKKSTDIFRIIKEEEKGVCSTPTSKSLNTISTFTSRVSSGSSRRITTRTGDFLIDLKVYRVEDFQTLDGLERYKKALAVVKLQCEEKSVEWEQIQKFLSSAFILFKESDPTFFSNDKKYK